MAPIPPRSFISKFLPSSFPMPPLTLFRMGHHGLTVGMNPPPCPATPRHADPAAAPQPLALRPRPARSNPCQPLVNPSSVFLLSFLLSSRIVLPLKWPCSPRPRWCAGGPPPSQAPRPRTHAPRHEAAPAWPARRSSSDPLHPRAAARIGRPTAATRLLGPRPPRRPLRFPASQRRSWAGGWRSWLAGAGRWPPRPCAAEGYRGR